MSKVWFVTGSSRGLGRALVEVALEAGDCVAATARNPERCQDLLDKYGDAVLLLRLDVTDYDAAARVVAQVMLRARRPATRGARRRAHPDPHWGACCRGPPSATARDRPHDTQARHRRLAGRNDGATRRGRRDCRAARKHAPRSARSTPHRWRYPQDRRSRAEHPPGWIAHHPPRERRRDRHPPSQLRCEDR